MTTSEPEGIDCAEPEWRMDIDAYIQITHSDAFARLGEDVGRGLRQAMFAMFGFSSKRRMEFRWELVTQAARYLPCSVVRCCGGPVEYDPETEHFPLGEHFEFDHDDSGASDNPMPQDVEADFWIATASW